jgi:hypothetical protein
MMAQQTGEEKTKIFSNIRQIGLEEVLLDEADGRESSLTPDVRFKRMKQTGTPTEGAIDQIIAEEKKPPQTSPTTRVRYRKFFLPECSIMQIETVIKGLSKDWRRNHKQLDEIE